MNDIKNQVWHQPANSSNIWKLVEYNRWSFIHNKLWHIIDTNFHRLIVIQVRDQLPMQFQNK